MTTVDEEWWKQFCAGRISGQATARSTGTEPPPSFFSSPADHMRLMDNAQRNDPSFGFEVGWLAGYYEEHSRV
jgi:hypothetical protein